MVVVKRVWWSVEGVVQKSRYKESSYLQTSQQRKKTCQILLSSTGVTSYLSGRRGKHASARRGSKDDVTLMYQKHKNKRSSSPFQLKISLSVFFFLFFLSLFILLVLSYMNRFSGIYTHPCQ